MSDMISAICVSMPSRYGFLQRAIYNFAAQDYYDRELLIAIHDEEYFDKVSSWLLDSRHVNVDLSRVRVLRTTDPHIGKQAAEAFKESEGSYLAVWSDDNLSHVTRLSSQLEHSRGCATVVAMSFYYFYDSDELFITDYCQPGRTLIEKCAVSSLIVSRDNFCCDSLRDSKPDDHWSSVLVKKLASVFPFQQYRHLPEKEDGFLFMQGVCSDNQRGMEYHRTMGSGLPLTWTRAQVLSWASVIDEILAGYMFPGGAVDVAGKDAAACVINGTNICQWPLWLEPIFSNEKLILDIEG